MSQATENILKLGAIEAVEQQLTGLWRDIARTNLPYPVRAAIREKIQLRANVFAHELGLDNKGAAVYAKRVVAAPIIVNIIKKEKEDVNENAFRIGGSMPELPQITLEA